MIPLGPCYTASLFRPLLGELIILLRSLSQDEWERQTVAPRWRVRDVAAHLLDGDLRKIAVYRDDHRLPLDAPITGDDDLARFINGLNATGVAYAQRLSPRLLIELLEITGSWVAAVIDVLPPHGVAHFPVSWAGERTSENWMDTGRGYTERWHHQAQIRDACGRARLLEPRWFEPLMDISVRVLPRMYASTPAAPQASITLTVEGETNASWTLAREAVTAGWTLFRGAPDSPSVRVRADADAVWRLFYNALAPEDIQSRLRIEGDAALAGPLLKARSVIL